MLIQEGEECRNQRRGCHRNTSTYDLQTLEGIQRRGIELAISEIGGFGQEDDNRATQPVDDRDDAAYRSTRARHIVCKYAVHSSRSRQIPKTVLGRRNAVHPFNMFVRWEKHDEEDQTIIRTFQRL